MEMRHVKPDTKGYLLLAASVAIFAALLSLLPPIQVFEHKITDQFIDLHGPLNLEDSPVVIVEISQEADEEIPHQFPWPRSLYARLIENLNQAGAKVIAIDVLFDQPGQNPVQDSLLAESISKYGNVILIGGFRVTRDYSDDGVTIDKTTRVMPNPLLYNAMSHPVGIVDMKKDADGFIRDYPLIAEFMGESLFSLAVQTLVVSENISRDAVINEQEVFRVGRFNIPKNRNGMMYIQYYGAYRSFPYYGFEKVIDDENFETKTEIEAFEVNEFSDPEYGLLSRDVFRDKIVLVGATMPELQDFHLVPVKESGGEPMMAGVEVHANALQTILDQNFLTDIPGYIIWVLTLMIALLIPLLVQRSSVWSGFFVVILTITGILAAGYILLIHAGLVAGLMPPVLAVLFAYVGANVRNYLIEQREKQRVTSMFSSYVSPELVTRLLDDENQFELAGETKELTVLFSDIANFSRLSESIEAEKVVVFMNRYLDLMTKLVTEESGTLDKYIGDAVMAFYGAPVTLKTHAVRACRSALRMQHSSVELSKSSFLKEELSTDFTLHTRIGVNTGKMVVGNMGSKQRFNYTVMGDNVNIGARCETACKEFGVSIIVTENTKKAADNGEFVFRYLGRLRVKGRRETVDVYHLVNFANEMNLHLIETVELFNRGIEAYLAQKWKEAGAIFRETAKSERNLNVPYFPDLNPSVFYLKKCRHLITYPPSGHWDGAIEQKVK